MDIWVHEIWVHEICKQNVVLRQRNIQNWRVQNL